MIRKWMWAVAWLIFLPMMVTGFILYGNGPGTVWFAVVAIVCTLPLTGLIAWDIGERIR